VVSLRGDLGNDAWVYLTSSRCLLDGLNLSTFKPGRALFWNEVNSEAGAPRGDSPFQPLLLRFLLFPPPYFFKPHPFFCAWLGEECRDTFPAMSERVLILGAGLCGLAAAWQLLEGDPTLDVTLVEQEPEAGGLARSITLNGQVADMGPHRIFTELPEVKEFLKDLAGDEMELVVRKSQMWLQGGWIEYPPKPLEVMRHLGVGTLAGAGLSFATNKAKALLSPKNTDNESFESIMTEAFGPDLYQLLIGSYARKTWKVPPSQIHGDIARVRVSAGGLDQMIKKLLFGEKPDQITSVKKFHYLPGGVVRLVDKLREGVLSRGGKIELVRQVVDVKEFRTGHLQVLATNKDNGEQEVFHGEKVLSTIPVCDLLGMLLAHQADEKVRQAKDAMRYIANFLVCLVIDRPQVSENQWLYFPEKDTVFNRGYEPKNFHSSMGTADQSMIMLEITCHPGDEIWNKSDKQLINATVKGLEKTGLISRKEVASSLVHRIPFTYPLYDLEYKDRMNLILRYLEQFKNLASIGRQGLFLHNNMDHSIQMGFDAGRAILSQPKSLAKSIYHNVDRYQSFRIVD
jgi:protoporphyrinogen oxidase